jgi:hypothetical protein
LKYHHYFVALSPLLLVIKNGKSNELEALSQIQKPKIKQYILSDARYFKETFDFLMRCDVYTLEHVSNIVLVKFPKEAILILSALK